MIHIVVSKNVSANYGSKKDLRVNILNNIVMFYVQDVFLFKIDSSDFDNIIKTAKNLYGEGLSEKEYFLKAFYEIIDRYLSRHNKRIVDISYVDIEELKSMLIDLENHKQFEEVMDLWEKMDKE